MAASWSSASLIIDKASKQQLWWKTASPAQVKVAPPPLVLMVFPVVLSNKIAEPFMGAGSVGREPKAFWFQSWLWTKDLESRLVAAEVQR